MTNEADDRRLYETLLAKLFDGEPHRFAHVSTLWEYERHLPTNFRVDEEVGWPLIYRLAQWTEENGWTYEQLREVWTHSNVAITDRKLRTSRAPKWPRVINAPWLITPRTVAPQTR